MTRYCQECGAERGNHGLGCPDGPSPMAGETMRSAEDREASAATEGTSGITAPAVPAPPANAAYRHESLKDEGPGRKYPRYAVIAPDGSIVRTFNGSFAASDARNEAVRLNRKAEKT